MIKTTVSRRRELASERFLKEGEDRRAERGVRRHGLLANQVAYDVTGRCRSPSVYSIRGHGNPSTFLLYSVGRRFRNAVQYDESCNSYTHHHNIRFKEMQSNERAKADSQEAIEKQREKERKREKELWQAARAAGVRLNTTQNSAVATATPGIEPAPTPSKNSGFTFGGWPTANSSSPGTSFKQPGWIAVSGPPKPTSPPPPSEPPRTTMIPSPTTFTSGFRSRCWTTLKGPPPPSTSNRPPTPNVDYSIPPQRPQLSPRNPLPFQIHQNH